MTQKHVYFYTNVGKSQISENDKEFVLKNIPVTVDNAVMNRLLYTRAHNEKGMPSLQGRVVTLTHPTDKDGNGIDAYDGEALQNFFSGGKVDKVYSSNGTWFVDTAIRKNQLKSQDKDNGTDFYGRLKRRENIGVSTGLYYQPMGDAGVVNGEEYDAEAGDQQYNHLAMLESSEPPAGGDATVMRFNSEGSIEKVESFVVNVDEYATMPETELKRISVDDEKSLVEKITNKVSDIFTKNQKPNEETDMTENMKNMIEALKKKGMYKDDMSEDDVKNAYDKMKEKMKDKDNMSDKMKDKDNMSKNSLDELVSAVNSLRTELGDVKAQLNAKENAEKAELIESIKSLDTGFGEDDLQNMSVNALQNVQNRFQPQSTFSINGQYKPSGEAHALDNMEAPE